MTSACRILFLLVIAALAGVGHAWAAPAEPLGYSDLCGSKEAIPEAIFDNCFLAGTQVETESRGRVRVEDVRVDDQIAPPPGHEGCEDPQCGRVVRLFRNTTDQVVTITAVTRPRARERRSAGGEEQGAQEDAEPPSVSQTIRCTPGHPFFVEGQGWVFAGDLREGDAFEARGEGVVVASVKIGSERAQTFNFEVACHHTYRVAAAGAGEDEPAVLVHNASRVFLRAMKGAKGTRRVGARTFKRHHVPRRGGKPARYYRGGNAAERASLARAGKGARREVTFGNVTSIRGKMRSRRLDVHQTTGGVRIGTESKVGWVKDARFYREQLTKDIALLQQGRIDRIRWDFRRSQITGEIGADPSFLAKITRAKNQGLDIDYRFLD